MFISSLMHTKIRNEFTSDGIKHHSNNFYYKSSWVKSEIWWLVQATWLQEQSSVWYAALQARLPSFHQGEGTGASPTQARLAPQPKTTDRLGWGDTQHPACSASQLPSQVGPRQEGRIFPPALPPSLTLLAAPWGLQCSIGLGKGTKGTISSEDKYSPGLHSETRWIYWAEPLKKNLNYMLGISPHAVLQLADPLSTAQQKKTRQSLGEAACCEPPYLL